MNGSNGRYVEVFPPVGIWQIFCFVSTWKVRNFPGWCLFNTYIMDISWHSLETSVVKDDKNSKRSDNFLRSNNSHQCSPCHRGSFVAHWMGSNIPWIPFPSRPLSQALFSSWSVPQYDTQNCSSDLPLSTGHTGKRETRIRATPFPSVCTHHIISLLHSNTGLFLIFATLIKFSATYSNSVLSAISRRSSLHLA